MGTISRVNPARYDKRPGNVYTVPTKNRFDVLADKHVTDAEPATSMSTSDQINKYRQGHRQRRLSELPDVAIEGDSVIKHIEGRLLNRKHRVVCHPNPWATVADISSNKATEGVKAKGDVVLHVGSNGLSKGDGSTSTADDIIALADVIAAKGCDVCLPSVIRRRWETAHQRRSVDWVNGRLKRAAREGDGVSLTTIT